MLIILYLNKALETFLRISDQSWMNMDWFKVNRISPRDWRDVTWPRDSWPRDKTRVAFWFSSMNGVLGLRVFFDLVLWCSHKQWQTGGQISLSILVYSIWSSNISLSILVDGYLSEYTGVSGKKIFLCILGHLVKKYLKFFKQMSFNSGQPAIFFPTKQTDTAHILKRENHL